MKYKSVYESCETLAMLYGEVHRNPGFSEHATYIDPFGCDFQIFYSDMLYLGIGERRKSMNVYLGGRMVYSFHEDHPNWECLVNGHWIRLVEELSRYELDLHVGEAYIINSTVLELCRRESAKNREILNRYREKCSLLAKSRGVFKKISDRTSYYKFSRVVDGHWVEIYLSEKSPKAGVSCDDEIELAFDKKNVFTFHFNSSNVGGLFDDKGDYTPGEWEKILERLAEEL